MPMVTTDQCLGEARMDDLQLEHLPPVANIHVVDGPIMDKELLAPVEF